MLSCAAALPGGQQILVDLSGNGKPALSRAKGDIRLDGAVEVASAAGQQMKLLGDLSGKRDGFRCVGRVHRLHAGQPGLDGSGEEFPEFFLRQLLQLQQMMKMM